MASAVIDAVKRKEFKHVLVNFHKNVSTTRIASYYQFKRRGYDKAFALQAFPNWEEGKDFYDYVFDKDPSAFTLQQGALYLSKKERYQESFSWIDKALRMTGNRIPSIRNTHAVILFRANISRAGIDTSVRNSLDRSMKILQECYEYDKRTRYHALTFAEQAIQYHQIFGDTVSHGYLTKADFWIDKELKAASWNRNLKAVSRDLKREIR